MKPLIVLRPEPGNQATVERAREMGLEALSCPLFSIEAVAWTAPDPRGFDLILLTSANALRHGGTQLAGLTGLAALAVGPATAHAASTAGFRVLMTGDEGVEKLLQALPGEQRILHLAGADHHRTSSGHAIEAVIVYRSVETAAPDIPAGPLVALVHSARAGSRFAELVGEHTSISVAAISAAAAAACGPGWAAVAIADQPSDPALLALAARLCQD